MPNAAQPSPDEPEQTRKTSDIVGDALASPHESKEEQGARAATRSTRNLIQDYLRWLDRTHSAVRVSEIIKGAVTTDADPLQLRSVFVDLNVTLRIEDGLSLAEHLRRSREHEPLAKVRATPNFPRRSFGELDELGGSERRERKMRRVNVFEALGFHSRVVLTGDPGSGKSTIGQFVTLALARARLGDHALLTRLGETWTHGSLVPVPVVLREFAAWRSGAAAGCANDVWEFLRKDFVDSAQDAAWVDAIRLTAAPDGEGALFLLDGWDETHDPRRLVVVAEALCDLARNAGPKCCFLLTSRPYAWDSVLLAADEKPDPNFGRLDATLRHRLQTALKSLHALFRPYYEVDKLEPAQVERFIESWYRAVQEGERPWFSAKQAGEKKADLEIAAARADLEPVVSNPLLLTLTAGASATHLPDDRADLFKQIVELLLLRWTERSGSGQNLRDALGRDIKLDEIRQKIEQCAFDAHREHVGKDGVADIPEHALKTAFASLLGGSDDLAKIVVEFVEKRAGLLIGKGLKGGVRQFSCPHRALQEFLAGAYLAGRFSFTSSSLAATEDEPPSAVALAREHPGHWREVLCFAARLAGSDLGSRAAHNLVHEQRFKEWSEHHIPTDTD